MSWMYADGSVRGVSVADVSENENVRWENVLEKNEPLRSVKTWVAEQRTVCVGSSRYW